MEIKSRFIPALGLLIFILSLSISASASGSADFYVLSIEPNGLTTTSTNANNLSTEEYIKNLQQQNAELQIAESEQKKLEQALNDAKAIVKELQSSKNSMEKKIRELDSQLNVYSGNLQQLEDDMEAMQQQIQITETNLADATEKMNNQYDAMKMRIQYIYENGNSNYVNLVLQAKNFSKFLNAIEYVKELNDYDRAMLTAFTEMKNYQAEVKEKLEEAYAAMEVKSQEVETARQAVAVIRNAKNNELKETASELTEAQATAKAYEEEVKAQAEILAQIKKQIELEAKARAAAAAAGVEYTGVGNLSSSAFCWPCPNYTRISSDYGNRKSPTSGASTNHQGVDMAAPYGSAILAAESGLVTTVAYSKGAGNYVMINHGNDVNGKAVYTVYMHCSTIAVSEGAYVVRGQNIAGVGSTGTSTGNHLHFGVSVGGSYVSPWGYISKP